MKKIKILATIILIILLFIVWNRYQTINMNGFTCAEYIMGKTEFSRDDNEKYSDAKSYKLKTDIYNDSMIYTTIDVEQNTVYKVTCMVKTNNVIPEKENVGSGAFICITDNTEQSKALTGTNDWQKLELKFNSKNRKSINIGFRLGGNSADCTGEVWFTDFKIEEGFADTDTEWNFACFVIKNTDIDIENHGKKENVKITMTDSDIKNIEIDIKRFEKACKTLSNNKMSAKCDVIYIDEPLTSLTFNDDAGYYVSPYNVEEIIDDYVQASNYDHIFTVIKLDSEKYDDTIEIHDWVGLGYMDYHGIGFSNIRIPSDSSKFMYIYDPKINIFPEEVFVHEFLHSLERTSNESGFETVELHDYEKYQYKNDNLEGLKEWYKDYMCKNIYDSITNKYIGLDERVYTYKPANNEDFKYSTELKNIFIEPENIIEELELIIKKAISNVNINFAN